MMLKKNLLCWLLLSAILVKTAYCIPTSVATETDDDNDSEWDEEDESSEADDDGRVYKNPRNSPSTECPRDEEQATLLGQKCLRKCSSDEDCKSKKKKCLCDGACGMSCIKPDRECPALDQPPTGAVTVSGNHFGSRAVYTCPHGYHVVGLQSRLCQADGTWAGSEPICKQNIYCLQPPIIEHARHSALPEQATFDLDSTVQYHCHNGYATAGFPRAKCLAVDGQASWYGPDISCEPRSCGQPPDPAHGWHSGESYTFGGKVTYHCGDGYELVGKAERYCQADGSWTPKELPTCVLVTSVQCPSPENPRNGKAIYTSTSYNSVVSYECRYGYTLVGESSRRCGADKRWTGALPACKEINCGHPGTLYNGWLENIESGTGLGASIIFRCHPEMLLVGNTSSVCQIDGRWRYPLPQCLAPCVVPSISQGQVIPIEFDVDVNATTIVPTSGSSSKVKHGTVLEVICDEHYEFPFSSLSPPTCNNGTWSVIPRCAPARCKTMPKPPKFGMVLAPKTEHGMRARFKCKDGYNLTAPGGKELTNPNDYVLICSFGNWTGETPLCQEVYCAFPGYIPNGKVLLVGNMGLYDYRPYVRKVINNKQIMYECDKGYVIDTGPPGATCIGGKWSPRELPACIPGQHPRLRWTRRRRSIDLRLRFSRSNHLKQHYRYLKRKLDEHNEYNRMYPMLQHERAKRDLASYRGQMPHKRHYNFDDFQHYRAKRSIEANRNAFLRNAFKTVVIRERRELTDVEKAYNKYYERIKAKYRNYVQNLLGYNKMRPLQKNHKVHVQDGRWYTTDPESVSRNRVVHKARIGANDFEDESTTKEPRVVKAKVNKSRVKPNTPAPIAVPDINEKSTYKYDFYDISEGNHSSHLTENDIYSNYFPPPLTGRYHTNWQFASELGPKIQGRSEDNNRFYVPLHHNRSEKNPISTAALMQQLHSQIIRRKRDTKEVSVLSTEDTRQKGQRNNRKNAGGVVNQTDATGVEGIDPAKKAKFKGPCEALASESYAQLEIVRPGKDPNETFGPGTIVRVICGKGYTSNMVSPNATSKCVRGRWKPIKPTCNMKSVSEPCFVPSTEHGKYYAAPIDQTTMDAVKPTTAALTPMETIENGLMISFQCDPGFNTQGPSNLRCWNGEWASSTLPECLPAPCVLPHIMHTMYQGGYRPGLTIAHGSSVMIQCESGMGNLAPVQMDCALGSITPETINCGYVASRKSRDDDSSSVIVLDGGNVTSSEDENDGRDCGPPGKIHGSLVYKNGEQIDDSEEGFHSGTEITFDCIASITGEQTTWKIICEDGQWIGRSMTCDDDDPLFHRIPSANGSCVFRNNEPHVVSFYNDLEIREDIVEFPPATTIISRCVDIGKYAMIGTSVRTCVHSEWTGQKPSCFGLNQENDYAMEKSPTILIRHQNGPIAQSNDGKLIVYPGTTVHLECLWMRRFGNPKWNVSHDYRKYPEGWSSDEGRDPQLEYRISIMHAVKDDSGIFTCVTPARHTHSVEVIVKPVHCNEIQVRRGLSASTTETMMGTRVLFSCTNGNALIGTPESTCLPSGNWSAPLPVCESVECGEVPIQASINGSAPRVAILSREVGGRAAFSCPPGYGLRGPSEAICLPSGEWGAPFPTCVEVQCFHPGAPQNGYAQGTPPYRAGDVVQFNCNPEYMMQGQPIIACQDNGRWSGGLPQCVQACSYPGTAISGRMSSVKFYYSIGESITFTCDAGLELRGAKMLKCLKNGKWSNAIPTCVNPDAVNVRSDAKGIFKRDN
ncbi:sushi, von Willebrand factor type A, EGF and pentraxin domain-containing protein 1 isoform X1 [Malaya genurostris]|uniref:sushi, von Willebrand factor type A, EGF and pentraxin domain-containing protein 1 isoform X1 n=1 Tax=Malaya genurostris TaxID=325434 RepID=UPI0026F3BEC6|nr:sushi, von Willebrand factor type A, EGF and pentraxin domain-containing protein 1 isoform X1 [Malaya genurostris]